MKNSLIIFLCIFNSLILVAQTGPGGVGNATTNVLWLSADQGVYSNAGTILATNGGSVQQWNDRSGNSISAINTITAEKPTYQTSIINGLPVIRFSTGGTIDRLLASGVNDGDEATVIVVARYTSLPSDNPGIIHAAPNGDAFSSDANEKTVGIWVDDADGNVWGRAVEDDGDQRNITEVQSLSANNYHIISTVLDYNGTDADQFVNGITSGSATMDDPLGDWSEFGIGAQANEGWNGDIVEVIVYNTALNLAQRIIVENYLAAKYGLDGSFNTNDFYDEDNGGNGNYDFDVAGIGRVDASNLHNDAQSNIVRIRNPSDLENSEFYVWGHDNGPLTATTAGIPTGVIERFTRIWRASETGGDNNVGNVDVSFDMTGYGPFAASDLRLLISQNNDTDFGDPADIMVTGAINSGGNTYTFQNVSALTNNRRFTLGIANVPLPIELIRFIGKVEDSNVLLTWSTATETNNNYFTIESSHDGRSFELVDTVRGAGNSNVKKDYSLIDTNPFGGKSYYRLTQTDYDGTTKSFPLVVVELTRGDFSFNIYPNPTQGEFYLELSNVEDNQQVSISVSDLQGKLVISEKTIEPSMKVKSSISLSAHHLLPGIYLVKIKHGGQVSVRKLVVE